MRKLGFISLVLLTIIMLVCAGCTTEQPIREVPWTGEGPPPPPSSGTRWIIPEEDSSPVSPETSPATPEETINAIIQKELGVSNREGVQKITGVDIVNAGYGYNIDIHFTIDDNLSESFIKGGAQTDVFDTMKALYASSIDIQWVDMYGTFSMVDKYGNSSEIEVLHARLGRGTANKTSWDNMDRIRLFGILDFLEWHSAFRALN